VREHWARGVRVDYLIVDEAQFLSPTQVDQLAELADDSQIDVYAFGLATDFRSQMFPGSARLFELADELHAIQVEVLCWCGLPGRFNSRIHNDVVVRDGTTVLVADTDPTCGRRIPMRRCWRSQGPDTWCPGTTSRVSSPPCVPPCSNGDRSGKTCGYAGKGRNDVRPELPHRPVHRLPESVRRRRRPDGRDPF
jgi:hypothetical protein